MENRNSWGHLIKVETENPVYFSEQDILFKRLLTGDHLVKYPEGKEDIIHTIPFGEEYVFWQWLFLGVCHSSSADR